MAWAGGEGCPATRFLLQLVVSANACWTLYVDTKLILNEIPVTVHYVGSAVVEVLGNET